MLLAICGRFCYFFNRLFMIKYQLEPLLSLQTKWMKPVHNIIAVTRSSRLVFKHFHKQRLKPFLP